MENLKKLPIGIQDFEELRQGNYVYVDKTKLIHHLITNGVAWFLSRPRRFGKSLLISTLAAIFQGRRDLFDELFTFPENPEQNDQKSENLKNVVFHRPFWFRIFRVGDCEFGLRLARASGNSYQSVTDYLQRGNLLIIPLFAPV
uniref:Predicted AAA-ATPase n=1 Tax=Candidatus Kentrum sp. LPFa TaxID=2126335 RepID=A0A450X768_9GAMM|nr:MAG: Predicted AAA-ATPase [Candidatus Kentron sp. LPFa]VFK25152.1 MAG: Predicted AAA-ATPase [Candidatus Kentron sp. LPFa]